MKTQWTIDPAHSEIGFKIKHLLISNVTGRFKNFHANIENENEDFTDAKITFEAEVNSITTGNEMRDAHLQADDFFNSKEFPYIRFVSSDIKKYPTMSMEESISKWTNKYKIEGDLTIRDITKPIILDVVYNGQMTDYQKNVKAGFEITGCINRKEFGLKFNAVTETGSIMLGDEVDLILDVQMKKIVKIEQPETV